MHHLAVLFFDLFTFSCSKSPGAVVVDSVGALFIRAIASLIVQTWLDALMTAQLKKELLEVEQ